MKGNDDGLQMGHEEKVNRTQKKAVTEDLGAKQIQDVQKKSSPVSLSKRFFNLDRGQTLEI